MSPQPSPQAARGPRTLLVAHLIALGTALHGLEALLFPPSIPFRPGLANVVVVLALVRHGSGTAGQVALGRVLVSSLVWGTLLQPGFFLALAGALSAWAVMSVAHALPGRPLSALGLSLLGAAAHLLAQCLLVVAMTGLELMVLLPFVAVLALVSGGLVGGMALATLRQMPPVREWVNGPECAPHAAP